MLDLIEPAFVAALRRSRQHAPQVQAGEARALSPRERQVAQQVCAGRTDKEIARAMGIGVSSVRTYLRRIFDKSGVQRRAGLAQLAQRLREPA